MCIYIHIYTSLYIFKYKHVIHVSDICLILATVYVILIYSITAWQTVQGVPNPCLKAAGIDLCSLRNRRKH